MSQTKVITLKVRPRHERLRRSYRGFRSLRLGRFESLRNAFRMAFSAPPRASK